MTDDPVPANAASGEVELKTTAERTRAEEVEALSAALTRQRDEATARAEKYESKFQNASGDCDGAIRDLIRAEDRATAAEARAEEACRERDDMASFANSLWNLLIQVNPHNLSGSVDAMWVAQFEHPRQITLAAFAKEWAETSRTATIAALRQDNERLREGLRTVPVLTINRAAAHIRGEEEALAYADAVQQWASETLDLRRQEPLHG